MRYIENVVIGKPLVDIHELLAKDLEDWNNVELEKTLFTEERFLPKILVEAGLVGSTSEVRRNKPELVITLDKIDFVELKWGKRRLWIVVGE